MAFIETIKEEEAAGEVREMYEKEKAGKGYVPNFAKVFSHRPNVMEAWRGLLKSVNARMDPRRYELVTLAAARALKSSYCMLAHGSVLSRKFYSADQVMEIAGESRPAPLTAPEIAMMEFAGKIVCDASSIHQTDIDDLRRHGFSDPEIFEIAATAAARCFFSKMLDALGAEPDKEYLGLDEQLRLRLTVGRPMAPASQSESA